jgi:UDP-galactopyranose mutase
VRNLKTSPIPKSRSLLADESLRDVLTFSHLRWDFVFQRPQHLMARFSKTKRVFYFEEPIFHDDAWKPGLESRVCEKTGVIVLRPHLERGLSRFAMEEAQKALLESFCETNRIRRPLAWYYTPALFCYSKNIDASVVVYDCMDELANFRFASPQLPLLERELMARADLVFTGGHSLYEAKRRMHPSVHCFPSSVDRTHFATARDPRMPEPSDQTHLPRPRLGFYGVIDERMDFDLIASIADARPDWTLVLVGPVAKVSPEELPRRRNIHYLGSKTYDELPRYLAGWDVALMPFAINEATRFISPTKTPEYLAGGKPVVSTPISDVVRQFAHLKGVKIAQTPSAFVRGCEEAIALTAQPEWLAEADSTLANASWDRTFSRMNALIESRLKKARLDIAAVPASYHADVKQEHEVHIES